MILKKAFENSMMGFAVGMLAEWLSGYQSHHVFFLGLLEPLIGAPDVGLVTEKLSYVWILFCAWIWGSLIRGTLDLIHDQVERRAKRRATSRPSETETEDFRKMGLIKAPTAMVLYAILLSQIALSLADEFSYQASSSKDELCAVLVSWGVFFAMGLVWRGMNLAQEALVQKLSTVLLARERKDGLAIQRSNTAVHSKDSSETSLENPILKQTALQRGPAKSIRSPWVLKTTSWGLVWGVVLVLNSGLTFVWKDGTIKNIKHSMMSEQARMEMHEYVQRQKEPS